MLAFTGIIFFMACWVLLCLVVVMKIFVTQQCESCVPPELGRNTAGMADPKDVPDPVMFCSAVKTGEEAERGEIWGLCSQVTVTHAGAPGHGQTPREIGN